MATFYAWKFSMRTLPAVVAAAALGSSSCAHDRAEIASLEGRVAALESRLDGASHKTAAPTTAPPEIAKRLVNSVPVELGDAEFHDGDTITITEIRGTEPSMRPGGTFLVKGRYHLASRDGATLLFSITATQGSGRTTTPEESRLLVTRGDGEFALFARIDSPGYPHLTFYGANGQPFGGVYFGNGDSLLSKKAWRYREP